MDNEKRSEKITNRAEAYAHLIALPFRVKIVCLCVGAVPLYELYRLLVTGQLHTPTRLGKAGILTFQDDPIIFLVWFFLYLFVGFHFSLGGILALFGRLPNRSTNKDR